MSASPPSPLPARLRPVNVEIPGTWTPEQALAVFDHKNDMTTFPDRPDF